MAKRLRSIVVLAVLVACLVVPATSQATLVFTRNPFSPTVYVANDNGSSARKIGAGSNPRVSPDGQTVVFYRLGKGNQPADLMVAPAAGGAPKKLASGWQDPFVFAWSPDSTTIAVLLGPEVGKQRLVTVDLASGQQHTIDQRVFLRGQLCPRRQRAAGLREGDERKLPASQRHLPDRHPSPRRRQRGCRENRSG